MRIFGTRHADVLIGTDGDDEIRGLLEVRGVTQIAATDYVFDFGT